MAGLHYKPIEIRDDKKKQKRFVFISVWSHDEGPAISPRREVPNLIENRGECRVPVWRASPRPQTVLHSILGSLYHNAVLFFYSHFFTV